MAAVIGTIKRRIIKDVSPAGSKGLASSQLKRNQRIGVLRFPPALNNPSNWARARRGDAPFGQYLPRKSLLSVKNRRQTDF
jgi:hypothetical protein